MFTSGTTGEPKGVMHTHNSLFAAIEPSPEDDTELPADTEGRLQVTGPLLFAGHAKRLDLTGNCSAAGGSTPVTNR